jgi:hypothetical protein
METQAKMVNPQEVLVVVVVLVVELLVVMDQVVQLFSVS